MIRIDYIVNKNSIRQKMLDTVFKFKPHIDIINFLNKGEANCKLLIVSF